MSRSFEAGGKYIEVKIGNVDSRKISSEDRLRPKDLTNLQELGRQGWLREVVCSKLIKYLIILIVYIPPGGEGIKLKS